MRSAAARTSVAVGVSVTGAVLGLMLSTLPVPAVNMKVCLLKILQQSFGPRCVRRKRGEREVLDAHRLRVLVERAHDGSITAAAERLSFTPPALSQQLTKLEREVGVLLVERGRTGVRLTEAGRVLLEHGERVLGELRDAEAAVRALVGEPPDRLSLGAF